MPGMPKRWRTSAVRMPSSPISSLTGSASQLSTISDPFLQERYRFQRLRLMFYSGRHSEAEKYYNANLDSFKSSSGGKYRFMDIAAGSFRRNGKTGQSNSMYAHVFGHYGPLPAVRLSFFRPKEDSDWKSALASAKNDYDKQVLWQLLGISADGLGAIEKIFAISPRPSCCPAACAGSQQSRAGSRRIPNGTDLVE